MAKRSSAMRDDDFFWAGVSDGRLLFQECGECGAVRHPPGPQCPGCQSFEWQPKAAAGTGTVCAWIESKHPTRPDENPRIVALIELPEGVRLVSNLRDVRLADVRDGMPVTVFFEAIDGKIVHQFRPAGER
jgi:uncharacterized OB-fold protein